MNKTEQIVEILSTIFNKTVHEDCSIENEDMWDSITHLEIIVTLEEELGLHIPQDKISQMTSVKSILEVINKL